MARITGSYPDDLDLLIEGAVEAGVSHIPHPPETGDQFSFWRLAQR